MSAQVISFEKGKQAVNERKYREKFLQYIRENASLNPLDAVIAMAKEETDNNKKKDE